VLAHGQLFIVRSPGNGPIDAGELADNYAPVHRIYTLNIYDEAGIRIAEVEKTLYIRLKKPKPAQL
jgi:hypothetical protein